MSEVFRLSRIVEFNHCDPAGIVFYPRYFEMISATIERFFADRLDFGWHDLGLADGIGTPMGNINIDFINPSRLGETLDFELSVLRRGRSSVTVQVLCRCGGEVRFTCEATLVYANLPDRTSLPWPDPIRATMARYQHSNDKSIRETLS